MKPYYGIFKDLYQMLGTDCKECDLYEGPFAEVYDSESAEQEESSLYLAEAAQCGSRVLELCCGSGRLTTEFARCGFHVTGVDLSSDMLALLEQKKARLPKRVAERIRTRCCDVFAAEWKETYDFIFLPATTLCLLTGDLHQTAALFTRLSQALTTNGSLMFDIRRYDKAASLPLCAASFPQAGRVVLYQDRLDVLPGYDVANFLLIEKSAGSHAQFCLSASVKRVLQEADIEALTAQTPFFVARREDRVLNGFPLRFYTLKKREAEGKEI